jgi:hypothetical protein
MSDQNNVLISQPTNPAVDHPSHYGGVGNPYEAIKIIEALDFGFCLGNALKYMVRAGKKNSDTATEDLQKAVWYLNRRIYELEEAKKSDGWPNKKPHVVQPTLSRRPSVPSPIIGPGDTPYTPYDTPVTIYTGPTLM